MKKKLVHNWPQMLEEQDIFVDEINKLSLRLSNEGSRPRKTSDNDVEMQEVITQEIIQNARKAKGREPLLTSEQHK